MKYYDEFVYQWYDNTDTLINIYKNVTGLPSGNYYVIVYDNCGLNSGHVNFSVGDDC